jgi:hypothetical protein
MFERMQEAGRVPVLTTTSANTLTDTAIHGLIPCLTEAITSKIGAMCQRTRPGAREGGLKRVFPWEMIVERGRSGSSRRSWGFVPVYTRAFFRLLSFVTSLLLLMFG